MNRYLRAVVWALASFALAGSAAVSLASDAKVVRIEGNGEAYYTPLQGGARTRITLNASIPEQSAVETGPNVAVYLEAYSGAVATVRQNSKVELTQLSAANRRAKLNLRSGLVVSTLDPTKRTNAQVYEIDTPLGTAAARGTVYAVKVIVQNGQATTAIANLSGVVRITRGDGTAFDLPFGQGASTSAAAVALAQLVQSDPSVRNDIVEAVRSLAENVAGATSAAGSADVARSELALVTEAAVRATPDQASTIVNTAVQGAVTAGATTAGNDAATLSAISAVTEAAVRTTATTNPEQVGAITQAAATAVTSAGSVTGASDAALTAAVSALTAAAVTAAPTQATAAAQGAAQGVVNGRVTAAVTSARAANPNATAQQLAEVAAQAATSTAATAAVSAIATTATTNVLVATGQSGNAAAAVSTANTIANAVNNGSATGANTAGATVGAAAITAPRVNVNVASTGSGASVTATASTGTTTSSSTQTVSGSSTSALTTQTTSPSGTTTFTTTPAGGSGGGGQGGGSIVTPQNSPTNSIDPDNVSASGGVP